MHRKGQVFVFVLFLGSDFLAYQNRYCGKGDFILRLEDGTIVPPDMEMGLFCEKGTVVYIEPGVVPSAPTSSSSSSSSVSSSDWIRLNVGGVHIVTTRTTLCKEPDSMLGRMFGSQWWPNSTQDATGATMLDMDARLFMPILNYLRLGTLVVDPSVSRHGVREVAKFLQIQSALAALNRLDNGITSTSSTSTTSSSLLSPISSSHVNSNHNVSSTSSSSTSFVTTTTTSSSSPSVASSLPLVTSSEELQGMGERPLIVSPPPPSSVVSRKYHNVMMLACRLASWIGLSGAVPLSVPQKFKFSATRKYGNQWELFSHSNELMALILNELISMGWWVIASSAGGAGGDISVYQSYLLASDNTDVMADPMSSELFNGQTADFHARK